VEWAADWSSLRATLLAVYASGVLPAEVGVWLKEEGRSLQAIILRQHLRLQTSNNKPLFLLCGIKLKSCWKGANYISAEIPRMVLLRIQPAIIPLVATGNTPQSVSASQQQAY
jgi:hypothetical protein